MKESATPPKMAGKLDALPKEELIKYIKKQVTQLKDLKKKNEDLNLLLKHEKQEVEKMEQEQKAWLSRGVSAEFEKKEELERKERELQMAAHLGQQMLMENDNLRNRSDELEQENNSLREQMDDAIASLSDEKENIEQTLVMIQTEYKEAKHEVEKLKDALETAAAEHDKEHEKWEVERKQLNEKIMEFETQNPNATAEKGNSSKDLNALNKELKSKVDELQKQIDELDKDNETEKFLMENQELKAKIEANSVELKAQDESLKIVRKTSEELQAKNQELHQIVDMLSLERDESNSYSKQLDEELKKLKDEKEKAARAMKTLKGKLEKSAGFEEELKTHLNSLTSEKGELQLMVKNLQREKKTLMQSNKKLKEKLRTNSGRQSSLGEGKSDQQSLEKENEELKKEMKLLKARLDDEEVEIGGLKNENKVLDEKRMTIEKELEFVKEKLLEIENCLAMQKNENENDKAAVLKLQTRVNELLATLQSINEEKMHQESEIEELFKTHDDLQIKFDNECREKLEKEQRIQLLEEEITKQKETFVRMNEVLSKYKADSLVIVTNTDKETETDIEESENDVNEEKDDLKAKLADKQKELEAVNKQLLYVKEELEMERQEIKILQSNFREKVTSVEEFEENEKQIACINEESRAEISQLKAELEELRRSLHEKQGVEVQDSEKEQCVDEHSRVDMMEKEISDLKLQLDEKDSVIKEICRCKDELNENVDRLLKDIENQKEVIRDLNAKARELSKAVKELDDDKMSLMNDVESLNSVVQEKNEENREMKLEIDDLTSKTAIVEKQVEEFNKKEVGETKKDASSDVDKYKKGYKKIKEKFNEVGNINEKLKTDMQTKCIEIGELKKELSNKEEQLKSLQGDRSKEDEISNLLKIADERNESILELQTELRKYRDENGANDVLAQNEILKGEIELLTKKIAEHTQCMENVGIYEQKQNSLKEEIKKLLEENEVIKMRLEKEIGEASKLTLLIESYEKEKVNHIELLKQMELENNVLRMDKERMVGLLDDFENLKLLRLEETKKLELLEEENFRNESEKKEHQLIIGELKTELKENKKLIADLRHELEDFGAEKDSIFRDKDVEIATLKERISLVEIESENCVKELEVKTSEISVKDERILDLEDRLKKSEVDLKESSMELEIDRKRLDDISKEKEVLLLEKGDLFAQLSEKNDIVSALEAGKVEMERLLGSKDSEIKCSTDKLENELLVLKEENKEILELRQQLGMMKTAFEDKEENIKECHRIMKEQEDKLNILSKDLTHAKTLYENEATANKKNGDVEEDLKIARERIASLEETNKEKTEKISKFKSVAIKAKKEIDSLKEKTSSEKQELEDYIAALNRDIKSYNEEIIKQRQELASFQEKYETLVIEYNSIAKEKKEEHERNMEAEEKIKNIVDAADGLRVSLASVENLNASLDSRLKEKEVACHELTVKLNEITKDKAELEQLLVKEKSEHDGARDELLKLAADFEVAKKDVHQMKMISLEMDDYHRTLESLQNKLSDRENECQKSNEQVTELSEKISKLDEQIVTLEEKNKACCQEIDQLTCRLHQRDDDLAKLMTEKEELENKEDALKNQIENISGTCEEKMIEISELSAEKEKAIQQLKREKEAHQKDIQAGELKLTRNSTEMSLLQEAYENCKQEFESYKIRAQTVLKQQKLKNTENEDSQHSQEKSKLETFISQLKEKLSETNERLTSIVAENQELELENEKLQSDHNQLMKATKEKEAHWRNRFTEVQTELGKKAAESEEKMNSVTQENEMLKLKLQNTEEYEAQVQDCEETIKDLKAQLNNLRHSPKRQASRGKKVLDEDAKEPRKTPENLKLSIENSPEASHKFVERPGAEGMDSSELEAIDQSPLPATPVSVDAANILEKILSPNEQQAPSSWPTSPISSKEEGLKLRTSLLTAEKNVEHLSVLLAETEGSNVRLSEQIKVLKTEIRRMQQNQEREEALHNLEYLKNVIIKFMKCGHTERECMVPVLSTMLKLTPEEKQFITEFAKGEGEQGEDSAGWSSYVYRWTSFS